MELLTVIGLFLSVYLLWQQFFHPAFQPCNINSFINCEAVISGPVAKTLGIPTPLYGLIGYIVIYIAAAFRKTKLMVAFGLVFCLWIAYRGLFQLKVICPVCIMCQLTMISIFILSLKIKKHIELNNVTGRTRQLD